MAKQPQSASFSYHSTPKSINQPLSLPNIHITLLTHEKNERKCMKKETTKPSQTIILSRFELLVLVNRDYYMPGKILTSFLFVSFGIIA